MSKDCLKKIKNKKSVNKELASFSVFSPPVSLSYSHHSHVVLWLQRDHQHFGPAHHPLHAGRGDSLPCDAVDLVKGVWFQELLVRCADIDLEPQLSSALVPAKLITANQAR